MAAWSHVATSDLGRAFQDIGRFIRHWLKWLCGVVTVSIGTVTAAFAGWLSLQFDRVLPGLLRHLCLGLAGDFGGACLLPVAVATIRTFALALLLAGLLLAAFGFVQLCSWHLDRR